MSNLFDVVNLKGDVVSNFDINLECFKDLNPVLLKEVVEYHQNKKRLNGQETKKSSYSNRKLYRQKGTGNARVGKRGNNPGARKGRLAFGPNGRIYTYKIPKKKITSALSMVVKKKIQEKDIIFVDNLVLDQIKTKKIIEIKKSLNLSGKNLFIDIAKNDNFFLSIRNIFGYNFLPTAGINVLDLLKHDKVVMTKSAWDFVNTKIGGNNE